MFGALRWKIHVITVDSSMSFHERRGDGELLVAQILRQTTWDGEEIFQNQSWDIAFHRLDSKQVWSALQVIPFARSAYSPRRLSCIGSYPNVPDQSFSQYLRCDPPCQQEQPMKVHRNPLLKNDMSSWWSLESTAGLDVCLVPPDLQKPLPGALNNNYIV